MKRVRQCAKCPWKVSTNPHDIPDGYSEDLHRALVKTIAEPDSLSDTGHVMACHEHPPCEDAYCVGWLMNQLGPGNNIPLRLRVRSCANIGAVELDGRQHTRFEDTLPMQGRKSAKRTVELSETEIATVEAAEVAPSCEDLNAEIDFKHAAE
ncbi:MULTISPECIES: DUF6283 family protein [Hyphomicrobiales]|uniref:DUF6283 family protein n=1 Tax=Methylobacterium sp. CCH7-A2 TaxID=1768789 RepID=UPI0012E36A1A|nr:MULTISPECIES: DUF6283 family protein [Hyphomicrobiales]